MDYFGGKSLLFYPGNLGGGWVPTFCCGTSGVHFEAAITSVSQLTTSKVADSMNSSVASSIAVVFQQANERYVGGTLLIDTV